MPQMPDGIPAPDDGALPSAALATLAGGAFGLYVHVPFCVTRCGYCDFNTYTLTELGEPGASVSTYADAALRELDLAARELGEAPSGVPVIETVFIGGGTPTMLPADDLVRILAKARELFGLAEGCEVATEANPDSVDETYLRTLADGGFTRVSIGMQSAVPHVLATLERTHDPANVERAVRAAKDVGLQVSLDLIYGAPGESLDDWRTSLDAAIALEPDHISAYALVVEEGTKMGAQVRRGELPLPDDDDEADKYELADALLADAGYDWYEVSNWARSPQTQCRHNLAYWRDEPWWGVGPGAHSHVGGVRWWNVKHPRAYAQRVNAGLSPALARELLDERQRHEERVLLQVRLAEGLALDMLDEDGRRAVAGLVASGLIDGSSAVRDKRVRLTLRGRLLTDTVVRALLAI
ncbi:radical SAM family heme chaperone HemW [Dermacoccus nishinomiyaensis]|uniref:radical SAM family heme chaperone HemW n=1 Tax=Dermacoccus nishinomiyaensis TaxID=1274 RepID=UPI0011A78516|nr:radical SAM family heme chaperone HemW [Dermacoccus nishinomiyaensis]